MELTVAHYIQLIAAVAVGIGFFAALYLLPSRVTFAGLVLLIPFQVVDSRYGSMNVVLTYMMFAAYTLLGRLRFLPLLGGILAILFAYAVSFGLSPPQTWLSHGVYMFSFLTNFLIFLLAYNVSRENPSWEYVRNILVTSNVLVIVYCIIQMAVPNEYAIGGISEFAWGSTRSDRLTGPFNATAATAEFLVIMAMVLLYGYLTEREAPRRWTYLSVFGVNTVFLLATGNRGGFVLFFLGVALFFWSFRKELGAGRIVRLVLTGTACMAMAAFIVLNFTRFNVMFDRLAGTEFESAVVPDTRVGVWEDSWEAILEAPITGHGPKLALGPAGSYVAGMQQISFPHSLPLYILYTTGVIGLLAYAGFFGALAVRLGRRLRRVPQSMDPAVAGIPRLSFIIFLLFCASQLRIEMLRTGLVDYQHFVFMLFGVLLGLCDHVAKLAGAQRTAPTVGISAVPAAAER